MLPANAKPEDRAKWVNENSDYTYLGKGVKIAKLPINSAEYVIAHEKFTLAKNGYGRYLQQLVKQGPVS